MPEKILKPDEQMVCPNCGDNTEGKASNFVVPGKGWIRVDHECYACNQKWVAWRDDQGVHVKSKF